MLQLRLGLDQDFVDHPLDGVLIQTAELNDGIQTVAELGGKQAADRFHAVRARVRLGEPNARAAHLEGSRVCGHDDNDVTEIGLAAVVVRQRAMIHDLQQQIEDIGMRLLDFIEQQHAMWMLGDGFGEQTALVKPHVTRRRTDEARDRVALHIFRHVEAHEFHAHGNGQLPGHLGLADTGRSGEQEGTHGLAVIPQP